LKGKREDTLTTPPVDSKTSSKLLDWEAQPPTDSQSHCIIRRRPISDRNLYNLAYFKFLIISHSI